jgi:hypothetical protein
VRRAVVLHANAERLDDRHSAVTGGDRHGQLDGFLASTKATTRQAGFLPHEDTVDNVTLLAKEVMPRLQEYRQPGVERIAAE